MKHLILNIIFLFLCIINLTSCAQQTHLEIIIDESCITPVDTPLKLYILEPKALNSVSDIITKSEAYYQQENIELRDSLEKIQNLYAQKQARLNQLKRAYKIQQDSLQKFYQKKIHIRLIDFKVFGKVWQFYTKFSNYGFDQINAVTLEIKFRDQVLVEQKKIPIKLPPEDMQLYPELYIDMSSNPGLHFKMSQCCLNRQDFLAQIQLNIQQVSSEFTHSLKAVQAQIEWLQNELLALDVAINTFPNETADQLQSRIFAPTNNLIARELATEAIVTDSVDTSKTLNYSNLKSGEYFIVLFEHTESDHQWYQNINLGKGKTELFFEAENKEYFFLNSDYGSPLIPEKKK